LNSVMSKDTGQYDFLAKPVQYLKGVGPKRAELLAKIGIATVQDLLNYFPRDYQDRTTIKLIRDLLAREVVTIQGTVQAIHEIRPYGRSRFLRHILKVTIVDGTGIIHAVWYNQPYRAKQFQEGQKVLLTGKTKFNAGDLEIDPIDFEFIGEEEPAATNRPGIVPIYPLSEGLEQRFLRTLVSQVLSQLKTKVKEILPDTLLEKYKFPDRDKAIREIHFPSSMNSVAQVRNRFVYEEFFFIQMAIAFEKAKQIQIQKPQKYSDTGSLVDKFIKGLPFSLTNAQTRVYNEITQDLRKPHPMNRLLQGDVGSGKTLVALLAMLQVVESGYQAILMVPTEVLAEQHFETFERWLSPLNISVALLTGSTKSKKRAETLQKIQTGEIKMVIGTHALLEQPVEFKNMALGVIDEQHRFGVAQRNKLRKKGIEADILIMTATPIPRTLSMTVYGDLEVSVLDEMPPGRSNIVTRWYSERDRNKVYTFLSSQVQAGRQVYFIYPLVEESDKMELRAAVQMYEHLQKDIFPTYRLGLIHGRMSRSEQQPIMAGFSKGEIDILVSTTVIEVGIDIPNATVMVIEHADRFGLSQLHQLRGRVGRGIHQSYCLLITPAGLGAMVQDRLAILTQTMDGFMIAEEDLRLRGPGELLGTIQHGINIFRIADLIRDKDWLVRARSDAFALTSDDPQLEKPHNRIVKKMIKNRIGQNQHYASVA
jgi:ATP-dependent DNA helicase RecG